jgi:hypothetical protein
VKTSENKETAKIKHIKKKFKRRKRKRNWQGLKDSEGTGREFQPRYHIKLKFEPSAALIFI